MILYHRVMPLKSVIFDWNGTIAADTAHIFEAAKRSIVFAGGNEIPHIDSFRNTTTVPVKDFYLAHGVTEQSLAEKGPEIAKEFHSHYETNAIAFRTRRGARKILTHLIEREITNVIASNHLKANIVSHLNRLRLFELFHSVFAKEDDGTEVIHKAGKLEMISEYLETQKIFPAEAMIVGDSPEEVQIGRKIGMKTVAISDGMYATHRLRKEKPDHLIHSLHKLMKIIEE